MTATPHSRIAGAGRTAVARVRGAMRAGGAAETGLTQVLDMHAVHAAGDALLTVALAGTLFFDVPVGQARGKVALYLLLTMAPFAVVAPVVGPVLDRFRHGRRWALALTLFGRALLALGIAWALANGESISLYPAAFGVLVLSKAYGVSRGGLVPRVLPARATLVQANARMSLVGLLATAVAAPLGLGVVKLLEAPWGLRLAAAAYVVGGVLALRLPPHVDSPPADDREPLQLIRGRSRTGARILGPTVVGMLRAAAAVRVLSGFLVLFVAFLVRSHPVAGLNSNLAIGLLAVAVSIGGLVGTGIGARLKGGAPEVLTVVALAVSTVVCAVTAYLFGLLTVLVLALVASAAQSVGRLALDAVIQRDTSEQVRTSAVARTDLVLQLSWVAGGGIGIALPLNGTWGFALAAAGLAVALVDALRFLRRRRTAAPAPGGTG